MQSEKGAKTLNCPQNNVKKDVSEKTDLQTFSKFCL